MPGYSISLGDTSAKNRLPPKPRNPYPIVPPMVPVAGNPMCPLMWRHSPVARLPGPPAMPSPISGDPDVPRGRRCNNYFIPQWGRFYLDNDRLLLNNNRRGSGDDHAACQGYTNAKGNSCRYHPPQFNHETSPLNVYSGHK